MASAFLVRARLALTTLALGGLVACANAALISARARIAAGDYAGAHRELVTAAGQPERLSASERREVQDALCLTEFRVGAPAYPLAEQLQECERAARQPASTSGPVLATVAEKYRSETAMQVEQAIRASDLVSAETGLLNYRSIPGADSRLLSQWSKEIWRMVAERYGLDLAARGRLSPTIARLAREHRDLRAMDERAFRRWVLKSATASGRRLVSQVSVDHSVLKLSAPDDRLAAVGLNLDRFVKINDGLVARCRCDGRTDIAAKGTGLPAYVVRLNPELRGSEVLILPRP